MQEDVPVRLGRTRIREQWLVVVAVEQTGDAVAISKAGASELHIAFLCQVGETIHGSRESLPACTNLLFRDGERLVPVWIRVKLAETLSDAVALVAVRSPRLIDPSFPKCSKRHKSVSLGTLHCLLALSIGGYSVRPHRVKSPREKR